MGKYEFKEVGDKKYLERFMVMVFASVVVIAGAMMFWHDAGPTIRMRGKQLESWVSEISGGRLDKWARKFKSEDRARGMYTGQDTKRRDEELPPAKKLDEPPPVDNLRKEDRNELNTLLNGL